MPLYRSGVSSKLGQSRYHQWLGSVRRTVLVFLATIVLCTLGLYLLHSPGGTPGTRLLDALWNAANTISTLGSLSTLNDAQRAFMIVAMLTVGIGGYALTSLVGTLSREDIQVYLENKRMEKYDDEVIVNEVVGRLEAAAPKIKYHPHSGWFEVAPPRGASSGEGPIGADEPTFVFRYLSLYRCRNRICHKRRNPLVPRGFATRACSVSSFLGHSWSFRLRQRQRHRSMFPGTAEPFRIAPAKPVAYKCLVRG